MLIDRRPEVILSLKDHFSRTTEQADHPHIRHRPFRAGKPSAA
jgi:hypothetical protein